MSLSVRWILFGWLSSSISLTLAQPRYVVTDYHVSFGRQVQNGRPYRMLRRFRLDNEPYCFLVDPQTLTTRLSPDPDPGAPTLPTLAALLRSGPTTPYERALMDALANAKPLQDAGIAHALPAERGIALTVDLCPSHKPLDRIIFTDLLRQLGTYETPVPLALSVTGVWMREHADDLAWVKDFIRAGRLSVTWINHSFNHRVSPALPLDENFLLEPGTNLADEVLQTEVAMIANGLLPSVFFRFPGLISDQTLVERVVAFGLIPVGSDAWLAKGQMPNRGSIVLIHGNGNEPIGVRDFLRLLRRRQADIAHRDWLLFDLREGVSASEQSGR